MLLGCDREGDDEGVNLSTETGDLRGSEQAGSIVGSMRGYSILSVLCVVSRCAWTERRASLVDLAGEENAVRAVGKKD